MRDDTAVEEEIEFRVDRVDAGAGGRLADAMRAEVAAMYDGLELDGAAMPAAGPRELSPPHGAFLVGWRGGEPVCCGGIKRLPDDGSQGPACEIKKMYVVPQARGQGVARALLAALEEHARGLGYRVARLDTGPRQPDAQHLYRSAGYVEIGNFNDNPVATFFAEKHLAPPGADAGAAG